MREPTQYDRLIRIEEQLVMSAVHVGESPFALRALALNVSVDASGRWWSSHAMNLSRAIRRLMRALIGPAIGMVLTGYFAYNLVVGDRGLLAWRHLTQQLRNEQEQLAAFQTERKTLAGRVSDLSPEHLDPDLLDERVRATLNVVAPNEVVIMRDAPPH